MDNKNIFATNLKKQMALHGKSRREICEALGFSYYTFSDWVNGKKYPRMDKVEMLANYFGIKKSDLIEDKSSEKKEKLTVTSERDRKIKKATELLERYSEEDLAWVLQMLERMPPSAK